MTLDAINDAAKTAAKAQQVWANGGFEHRAAALRNAADELRSRQDALALLITREMGKPILESMAEVEKCAEVLEYYAENAARFLADESCGTDADQSWVSYEPVGVVLAIMPWNFPLWQVFRCAAPALMAGNAILLKHSPNTTGCALEIENLLADAGLPAGTFITLLIAEEEVPTSIEQLIADPLVGAVALTGSDRAGSAVGSIAGREIKKCVLELGGSDAFVVLADANVPRVAALAANGRFLNAGQSCISPKRFIVEQSVVAEFTGLLLQAVSKLKVGNPEDPATDRSTCTRRLARCSRRPGPILNRCRGEAVGRRISAPLRFRKFLYANGSRRRKAEDGGIRRRDRQALPGDCDRAAVRLAPSAGGLPRQPLLGATGAGRRLGGGVASGGR